MDLGGSEILLTTTCGPRDATLLTTLALPTLCDAGISACMHRGVAQQQDSVLQIAAHEQMLVRVSLYPLNDLEGKQS